MYYHEMSIYEKVDPRSTRAGRARGGMSGYPEREGGGGGATLQHGNPNSRFHVSKCTVQILQGILLCKFQIPSFRVSGAPPWVRRGTPNSDSMFPSVQIPGYSSANSRFRVSEFRRPLCESAEGPQFPNSLFPREQIPGYSSANSRFQDSECADSRILLGKFQIPSFRVSEAPSWVQASEGPPNSRFRVSEFPRSLLGMLLGPSREGPTFSCFRV